MLTKRPYHSTKTRKKSKKMSDDEKSITVKVEYTEQDENEILSISPVLDSPEKIISPNSTLSVEPKNGECLWCSKKLIVKCTIAGFCSETCFTSSRRAKFKKEKFGIEVDYTIDYRPD